jgi:hypothetical protein
MKILNKLSIKRIYLNITKSIFKNLKMEKLKALSLKSGTKEG